MSASNDTKEDHGSQEPAPAPGHDTPGGGHCGHGAASALERLRWQRKEWQQQGGEPDDAAGVHAQ
jgi:hypothetical protein